MLRTRPFRLILLCLVVFIAYYLNKAKKDNGNSCTVNKLSAFPPPAECRIYHMCNYHMIPYVHSELASAYLLLYTNNSLVRFGDLDIDLMRGISWPNQNASSSLSRALLKAIDSPLPNLFVGIYDPFSTQSRAPIAHQNFLMDDDSYRQFLLNHTYTDMEYLSTIMTSPYILNLNTSCFPVQRIYATLRRIWKDKDVVILRGANNQVYKYDVFDTAKSRTTYYAPRYHAWDAYEQLKYKLFAEDQEKLFLLSAGPVAKVLTYDLTKAGRRAIDLGHLAKDYDMYMSRKPLTENFFVD